ncbi:hypothetical protein AURDEDRAFT_172397 [Auricularia subglabra TFB-10046 SS5]|nr:hypothetical protein AURDEDRAFT_172397 [Auricularia subglabra TFB-10046 SS5]
MEIARPTAITVTVHLQCLASLLAGRRVFLVIHMTETHTSVAYAAFVATYTSRRYRLYFFAPFPLLVAAVDGPTQRRYALEIYNTTSSPLLIISDLAQIHDRAGKAGRKRCIADSKVMY